MTAILSIEKGYLIGPSLLFKGLRTIGKFIAPIIDKAKGSVQALATNSKSMIDMVKAGKPVELYASKFIGEYKDEDGNPVGLITRTILSTESSILTIPAALSWVGHKIHDVFKNLSDGSKEDAQMVKELEDKMDKMAAAGDTEGLRQLGSSLPKFKSPLHAPINYLKLSFHHIIASMVGGVKGIGKGVKNFFEDKLDALHDFVLGDDKKEKKKSEDGGGSRVYGGSSGFISQMDPNNQNLRVGGASFAAKGCAPSVAAMLTNRSLKDATVGAQKFANASGVNSDYFADYLGKNGYGTRYITGDNRSNEIMASLARGQKVILAGKDRQNHSKGNSPFGKNMHYVLATGIDKNGNLIINDPENNRPVTYDASILQNTKMGIVANKGLAGSGSRLHLYGGAPANPEKIWAFFKSKGYSDAATAAIMGNLFQESGLDPAIHQHNGGPGRGLAQWTVGEGRFTALQQLAASKGKGWEDLDSQLEYIHKELPAQEGYFTGKATTKGMDRAGAKLTTYADWMKSKDVEMATRQFEGAYERAGKPAMANRINKAVEFYNQYSGKKYKYKPDDSSSSTSSSESGEETSTESKPLGLFTGGVLNAVSNLATMFTSAFSDQDATTSTSSSDDSSESTSTSGTALSGVKFKGKDPASLMEAIQGKLHYSQSTRNTEAGANDCSGTVRWAIMKAGGPDIGGYSGAQYNNPNLDVVAYEGGRTMTAIPASAKRNDVLFFSRGRAGRPDGVGHVGLYLGNNKYIDHGGPNYNDMGPNIKTGPGKNLIKISRVKQDLISKGDKVEGKGSGIYGGASKQKFTDDKMSKVAKDEGKIIDMNARKAAKYAAIVASEKPSTQSMTDLIIAISKLLNSIAANTSPIEKIYEVLKNGEISVNGLSTASTSTTNDTSSTESSSKDKKSKKDDNFETFNGGGTGEVSKNFLNLVGVLADIAKG